MTSRELANCDRVHVGPFRALATLFGALANLFCALANHPSSGAEETQEMAQDTHFKGQCIVCSVVSISLVAKWLYFCGVKFALALSEPSFFFPAASAMATGADALGTLWAHMGGQR